MTQPTRSFTQRTQWISAIVGAACLVAWSGAPQALAASGNAAVSSAPESELLQVLDLTNAERAKAGLGALTLDPSLSTSAEGYSQLLAKGGCMAHTCGPVPSMVDRNVGAGYSDWTALGENIAAGFQTPSAVVTGWMNSPEHRANILNPKYTAIGLGVANGAAPYNTYWAQEFGASSVAMAATTDLALQNVIPDPSNADAAPSTASADGSGDQSS